MCARDQNDIEHISVDLWPSSEGSPCLSFLIRVEENGSVFQESQHKLKKKVKVEMFRRLFGGAGKKGTFSRLNVFLSLFGLF